MVWGLSLALVAIMVRLYQHPSLKCFSISYMVSLSPCRVTQGLGRGDMNDSCLSATLDLSFVSVSVKPCTWVSHLAPVGLLSETCCGNKLLTLLDVQGNH